MTLTDKLAALPKRPTLAAMAEPNRVYLLTEVECLYAYNALLCEALEALLFHHDATCSSFTKCEAETDAKDVLAACEVNL